MTGRNPLVVALDRSDLGAAEALARQLAGVVAYLKVGLELFTAAGPAAVERVRAHAPVFLDLKLHDIPTTVARAAANAARLGAGLLTVHASGGRDMVRAAVEGAAEGARGAGLPPPAVVAVIVLSSEPGGGGGPGPAALAVRAVEAGAAGCVVSGRDVAEVRRAVGPGPLLVVPGIRPAGHPAEDHARVLAPEEALRLGADYLVVGRPVTGAPDPAEAARALLGDLGVGA
ncbi:MAG TPA: orotidine-5'-phosphate decarboxylase [Actinomycetota bacterium]|nr:orotidine-5'-phosphate decarboxylase [Actinomycetota bacterium]